MPNRIIYILLFSFAFISCNLTSPEEYYSKAFKYEERGNYEKAIDMLDEAIKKKNQFRAALLNRGYYKTEIGDIHGAIDDYSDLLQFDSNNTAALYNIANNYSVSKAINTEGAIKKWTVSNGGLVMINPTKYFDGSDKDLYYYVPKYEILYERGIEYLNSDLYDNAISDFKKSLDANYEKKNCYFLLVKAYIGKKDSLNACSNFIMSAKLGDKEAREMLKKHCL